MEDTGNSSAHLTKEQRLSKLDALEEAGVCDWEYYGKALEFWHKDVRINNLVENSLDSLTEIIHTFEISYPIDYRASAMLDVDDNEMRGVLLDLLKKHKDILDD